MEGLLKRRDLPLPPERLNHVAQERDACATLLGFAGLDLEDGFLDDKEIDELPGRVTFLPGSQDGVPREDPMIEHDAGTFLGWTPATTDTFGVRAYSDGRGKTMHIMNVNRSKIEEALGPDLLYYHVQRKSFVFVQYKRMTQEGQYWRYRVNNGFREQLEKMRELDEACLKAGTDGRFRLLPTPSFVKICRLDNLDIDSASMVSGMCMPRAQVESHIAAQPGAVVFDYDVIKEYFTSTLFAELVAQGYLGSSGPASDHVKAEVERSLNRAGGLVLGALDDRAVTPQRGRRVRGKPD